jgi:type II secretory pathway pseudopilin PulG
MNEKYLIVGLLVAMVVLIIVAISLVIGIKQSRAKLRQSQNNQEQPNA